MYDRKSITTPSEAEATLLARAAVYRLLSRVLADPAQTDPVDAAAFAAAEAAAGFLGDGELAEQIARLRACWPAGNDKARESYVRVFGLLVSPEVPPYEVEYEARTDVFARTAALADVAAFYNAFGLRLERRERPDHVAIEAEFLWFLLERLAGARLHRHGRDKQELVAEAVRAFFREHFGAWAESFASDLAARARAAGEPAMLEAAELLAKWTRREAARLAFKLPPRRAAHVVDLPPVEACDGCLPAGGLAGESCGAGQGGPTAAAPGSTASGAAAPGTLASQTAAPGTRQ